MSPQRVALNLLVTFLFVSAIEASSIRVTQCPAFRLSSILSSHSAKSNLPIESGYRIESPKAGREEKIFGSQEMSPSIVSATTAWTTEPNEPFSCKNKENGLYPVPDLTCTKYFYYCNNGFAYLYDCPVAGTIFYYDLCECDFPGNVPGCSGYTGEPKMTTPANQFKKPALQ